MGSLSAFMALRPVALAYGMAKMNLVYRPIAHLARFDGAIDMMNRAGDFIAAFKPQYGHGVNLKPDFDYGLTRAKAALRMMETVPRVDEAPLKTLLSKEDPASLNVAFADLLERHRANPGLCELFSRLKGLQGRFTEVYEIVEANLRKHDGRLIPDTDVHQLAADIQESYWKPAAKINVVREHRLQKWVQAARAKVDEVAPLTIPPPGISDAAQLQAMLPRLWAIMDVIRATPDAEITSLFFSDDMIHLIQGYDIPLSRADTPYSWVRAQNMASCGYYSELAFRLVEGDFPEVAWFKMCVPNHAVPMAICGEHALFFDAALGQITDVFKLADMYTKAGPNVYVLNPYAQSVERGVQATAHFLDAAPTAPAVSQRKLFGSLNDYLYIQPANPLAGYSAAYTLNMSVIWDFLFRANVGNSQESATYLDKAIEEANAAIEADDRFTEVHSALALFHRKMFILSKDDAPQHFARSVFHGARAVELNPYDAMAHYQLGRSIWEWGVRHQEPNLVAMSRPYFEKAYQLKPDLAKIISQLFQHNTNPDGSIEIQPALYSRRDTPEDPPHFWGVESKLQEIVSVRPATLAARSQAPERIMSPAN